MSWVNEDLLDDIGYGTPDYKAYTKKRIHISKGEVNSKNFSAQVFISEGLVNDDGSLEKALLKRWVVFPDGSYEQEQLIELETEQLPNNKLDIKKITVLGREVNLYDPRSVNNILGALKEINNTLRDTDPRDSRISKLPDIRQIFDGYFLETTVGDSLTLLDDKLTARRDFNIVKDSDAKEPALALPLEILRPLLGANKNTLDVDHSYTHRRRDFIKARGVIPETGQRHEMESKYTKPKSKWREIILTEKSVHDLDEQSKKREMIHVTWKTDPKEKNPDQSRMAKLKTLELFGQNMLLCGFRATMGTIGILNNAHGDMLNCRDYPKMQEYLAQYGLTDIVQSSVSPPKQERGRLTVTSLGGNNMEELYPDVGNEIGGNCKTIEMEWLDAETNNIERVGVIRDLGLGLVKNNGEWTGWAPDVVEKLKYCKHIPLSHHHLDHKDGLKAYIMYGLVNKSHTLHMTPEVSDMYYDMLTKAGIKKDDPRLPKVNLLEGTNAFDIRDKNDVRRMTVMYGADAVSHSARTTPIVVYGRHGDEVLGSVQDLGDCNYRPAWYAQYPSEFWDPVAFMHTREPRVSDPVKHWTPTYTTLDSTNMNREEHATTEEEIVQNTTRMLNNWFHDKHALAFMIGTNDSRRESLLQIGNFTQRFMTTVGAAVSFLFRVANKHGVNPYLVPRPLSGKYTGIKDYLEYHALQNGLNSTDFAGRTSQKVKSWFKNTQPGKLLVIGTGSQGNDIEYLSASSKLARRASLFDDDPNTAKHALPAHLHRDWVVFFSQTEIPGNNGSQRKLIDQIKRRGCPVVEAVGMDVRIHNPAALVHRIKADLKKTGHNFQIEADGSVYVENFSIHASGHGHKEDARQTVQNTKSKIWGTTHTDNYESVLRAHELFEEEGKKHPGRIFENFVVAEVSLENVKEIGRVTPSVVMVNEQYEQGKPYNTTLQAQRFVNLGSAGSVFNLLGLRGKARGWFNLHFGTQNAEVIRKRQKKKVEDAPLLTVKPPVAYMRPEPSMAPDLPSDFMIAA